MNVKYSKPGVKLFTATDFMALYTRSLSAGYPITCFADTHYCIVDVRFHLLWWCL